MHWLRLRERTRHLSDDTEISGGRPHVDQRRPDADNPRRSLPRPPALEELLIQREHGRTIDQAAFEREVAAAINWVVDKQIESGVRHRQ